ncbi:hypothetical protein SAMN05216486_11019 [bacterium JGI 053]|nr:hypothetical protein SAMN05216486_11019 [bacterium JGI 053]
MEVRIIVSGLCLFAPDSGLMHVLMPGSSAPHRHVAILEFDVAHLSQGSTGRARVTAQYSLRDLMVTFPKSTDGSSVTPTLCQQIGNLRAVTGNGVKPGLLQANPSGPLASRVTMQSGKNTLVQVGDACWNVPGLPPQPRRLAHRALWSIPGVVDGALNLAPTRFDGTTPAPISFPPLFPILLPPEDNPNGPPSDVIRLFLHHVPGDDLPPDPATPNRPTTLPYTAPHFPMFYSLFDSPASTPVPELVSETECDLPGACKPIQFAGGSPFTCMLAGTQP